MKMKVQEMNVDNKRIVLRCDFNVPIKNGVILDDTKIVASLETLFGKQKLQGYYFIAFR